MTRCQGDCHTPTAVPAPAGIDYASLTLISFPDGLISTGDHAFEGAAPLLAPIPKGILINRVGMNIPLSAPGVLLDPEGVDGDIHTNWLGS